MVLYMHHSLEAGLSPWFELPRHGWMSSITERILNAKKTGNEVLTRLFASYSSGSSKSL
jgi:hypothetical protein